jgi:hypothetical protein
MDPVAQVQRLEGDDLAKRRLAILLETLGGARTIEEACDVLGISATRFFELKQQMLQGALTALTPQPVGRPSHASDDATREAAFDAKIRELERDLQCALVRTELALVMPRLLHREIEKKTRRHRRGTRRGPHPPLAPPHGKDADDDRPAR